MGASADLRELRRISVADQVAGVLRQRILTGELRPGTPLLEIPLASSLGVSRNTMREAMRVLAIEGLVTRSVHRGVTVSELTPSDVREIYHLRRMLELSALEHAKDATPELLERLRGLVDDYETAVRAGDWINAVASDLQFHTLLIRFHNNRRLEAFYQKVLRELRMGMVLVDRGLENPARRIRVHRNIYQLLAAGKVRQCATALQQHLDDSEGRLSKVIQDHTLARSGKGEAGKPTPR